MLDPARSGPYFAGMLLIALISFWPSYLSQLGAQTAYTHLHASLAAVWIVMLIVQPVLIRRRRRDLHRSVGKVSYLVAPLIVVSIVFLAHSNIAGIPAERWALRTYILYLQISLIVVFAFCYVMAMITKRDQAVHARFMIATAFTLIDPILIRLCFWIGPNPTWNYQWLTFGVTDLVILALIFAERNAVRARWVFPLMLAVFVASQIPALLQWTALAPWQAFARWFAALPLT
jgi:FtsH-binding integral membrane protein